MDRKKQRSMQDAAARKHPTTRKRSATRRYTASKKQQTFHPVRTFFKVMLSIVAAFVVLAGGVCFAYHQVTGDWPFGADEIAKDADETSILDALLGRNIKLNVAVFGVDKDGTRTDVAFVVHYDSAEESLSLLSNPIGGILIFIGVMFLVFDISQSLLGPYLADILTGWIESFQGFVSDSLAGASPFMQALVADGIVGGVGAVVGFLPLVMVMYFLMALLEDCGYMARVSMVLDPIFKKVGLSGKSVISFVIGTGCAIPGVMAARTIRNERERRVTAMLTSFMPCGAKLPVIALFAGAFFADASWVGTLMYFVGIILIFFGALIINKIAGHKVRKSFFIMELPEYKLPSLKRAFYSMCSRGKAYIVKAGTVILVCNTVVQIMQSFTWNLQLVEEGMEHTSILATIASPFAILLIPLGFGAWQLAAAAITGFIAKENVVGTLAVCYGVTNFIDTEELALVGGGNEVAAIMGLTKVAALAYLMFNLYTPPCFAAMGAMNSEIKDKKWLFGGIGLQFATGFTIAFFVYQIGTLVTTGALGNGFVPGLIAVAVIVAIIVHLIHKANKEIATEYALGAGVKNA